MVTAMDAPIKTTVYLDGDDYELLKNIARREGRKPAELVREAAGEYARRHSSALPRSLGAGRSGKRNLGEGSEALLRGFGKSR